MDFCNIKFFFKLFDNDNPIIYYLTKRGNMKTLFTMDYKDYDSSWKHSKRDSARGIIVFRDDQTELFREDDKIALVYAKKEGYYKFPGGGIESNENKISALIREVSEEVGLEVLPNSVREFGVVPRLQKSDKFEKTIFDQESFYYFCKVHEKSHKQNLDAYELEAGYELRIVTIKDAIKKNKLFKTNNRFDSIMIERDTKVLQTLINKSI